QHQSEQALVQLVRAGEVYFLKKMHVVNKNSAADKCGSSQIRKIKFVSAVIRVRPRLMFALSLCFCVSVGIMISSSRAQQTTPTAPATLEGCLKCHNQIEPMHKYGPKGTLDKLDNGTDAMGLKCTECHGGNPVATTKDEAHVRPRF